MTTRREYQRDMTFKDIRQAARDLLVAEGLHAVTMNAVARRLGMSGPALYRYYDSHDAMIAGLTADFYREVTRVIDAARGPDQVNILAMSRALRHWALANRAEFRLIFASPPLPATQEQAHREDRRAATAFGEVFFDEVVRIWDIGRFPTPDPATLDANLRAGLERYARECGDRLPPEAVHVFLTCWIRLYGLLCMEVLRQIDFAITDASPVFEDCLKDLCEKLAINYQKPG